MQTRTRRAYQSKALSQLKSTGEQVLSICPGGGKTFTALEYMKDHFGGNERVLILAHGTNILKDQWLDELETMGLVEGVDYSTDVNSNAKIIVTIPQAVDLKKKVPHFPLVIVDEAHEFYLAGKAKAKEDDSEAGKVTKILAKSKPKSTLLLTGTPSKFIKEGYTAVIISGVEVYNEGLTTKEGYLSNATFAAVKSSYKLDDNSYNILGDLERSASLSKSATKSSLDALLEEMLNRLALPEFVKKSSDRSAIAKYVKGDSVWRKVFKHLDKTMIAANSTEQAGQIANILRDKGINVVLSDYKTDVDNLEVTKFIKDSEVKVLVVVRRGILGFNMPELVNVVDFTMSRNIDRIYQLQARVLRTHKKYPNKYFFRMCSNLNPAIDSYFLQASLCLNNEDFMSKYNGINLKGLEVFVPRDPRKAKPPGPPKPPGVKTPSVIVDMLMSEQILNLGLLSELTLNAGSPLWNEFAMVKMRDVISKLTGVEFQRKIAGVKDIETLKEVLRTGELPLDFYEQD